LQEIISSILLGIVGGAAWDLVKELLPGGERAKIGGYVVVLIASIAALGLMSKMGKRNSPPTNLDGSPQMRVRKSRRTILLGLLALAIFSIYVSWPSKSVSRSDKPAPPVSETRSQAPNARTPVFSTGYLKGKAGIDALAAQGNPDAIEMVTELLGTPLHSRALAPAFFKQKYFERALAGEDDLFAGLAVPAELNRILVLKVERSPVLKADFAADAIRIKEVVAIAVVDAQQGRTAFRKKLVAEGFGFNEESALKALKEDLANALSDAKGVFANGR
jgi:hypothetical protein